MAEHDIQIRERTKLHRSQIFFYILLSFILGVFAASFLQPKIGQSLADSTIRNAVLIAAAICALLIAVFYRRGSRLLNPRLALAAFLTLFFLAGILRFNTVNSRQHNLQKFAEAQEQVVDPQSKHPIKVTLYGYITSEPEISGNKQQFSFYAKQLSAPPYFINTDERVLITAGSYPRYQYGDHLKIYGQIKKPENFNDFDYRAYLAKDGVFTVMFYPEIKSASLKLPLYEKTKITLFRKIFAVKNAFERSIQRSVAEPNAAFIGGILLGSRSQIPQDIKDAFARTSTSHILAISGYNITMVALIISAFFLLFFRRPMAFWFSLAGVAVFTILTGAQASVVRAAIMGALVLTARREGRLNDPRNAIALAGAVMILINPTILRHDIGFQLSFAATLGLIYVAPIIEKYFTELTNIFDFRQTFVMTVSAQIFVLPLLLYYFKNLSLTSLPANLIILPTIPLAMLLGFFSGLAGMALPFLGQFVGYFAWFLTTVELGIVRMFAAPSWASISIGLSWYEVVAVYAFIVWALLKLSARKNGKTD